MKRENFRIKSTVGHDVVKHSWNASIREIEKLAREMAKEFDTVYVLTYSSSVKNGFYHEAGSRSWTNQKNGCTVVFSIQKEG